MKGRPGARGRFTKDPLGKKTNLLYLDLEFNGKGHWIRSEHPFEETSNQTL
jgi:hypothetical protein